MRKHTEREHKDKLGYNTKKTVTEESNQKYKCNFCDYASDTIGQIWNHKLDKHTGQSFNFNNIDKVDKNNFLFNLLAEQNTDVLEEVINMKKAIKEFFGQLIDDH